MYDPENYDKRLSDRAKERYMYRALKILLDVQASVKWISFEPLSDDFAPMLQKYPGVINWAVLGAASSGNRIFPPDTGHYFRLMTELKAQNIPVFFKGNMCALPEAKSDWHEEYPHRELSLQTP